MKEVVVKVLKKEGVNIPQYKCNGDAGMDIMAIEDVVIYPGEVVKVDTGLQVQLPLGYAFEVSPRSGISSKTHLRVNLGTVDSGYRGNIGVIVDNTSRSMKIYPTNKRDNSKEYVTINHEGNDKVMYVEVRSCSDNDPNYEGAYIIRKGDRIAQIKLKEVPTVVWDEVDSLDDSDRSDGGFGHTGV